MPEDKNQEPKVAELIATDAAHFNKSSIDPDIAHIAKAEGNIREKLSIIRAEGTEALSEDINKISAPVSSETVDDSNPDNAPWEEKKFLELQNNKAQEEMKKNAA